MSMKRELMSFGKLYLVLLALSLAFVLFKGQALWPPFALLSATYLVLLLPGYLLHNILYPEKMSFEERLTCSLAFGFVLLVTTILYLNALGLRINSFSATLMLLGLYGLLGFGVNRVEVKGAKHSKG